MNELYRFGPQPVERVEGTMMSSLLLSRLEHVGHLYVSDASLSELELPSLTWAGKVHVWADRTRSFAIDHLTEVGELDVSAAELTALRAPALKRAETLAVRLTPLRTMSFPNLEELRRIELVDTPALPACPLAFYFPRVDLTDVLVLAPPATCTCSLVDETIEAICE